MQRKNHGIITNYSIFKVEESQITGAIARSRIVAPDQNFLLLLFLLNLAYVH
jgi:hypothetical protein